MNRSFNPAIYFVAGPAFCKGRDIHDVVGRAIRGGVTMVQYRDKQTGPQVQETAQELLQTVRRAAREQNRPVPFLINDHVEIARNIGADGVHLGQTDMHPERARDILGENAIIGWTAFKAEHFKALSAMPPGTVDYVGTGPFFATQTKKDKPVLGAKGFAALAALSPVPVIAIGGITPERTVAVQKAGADGIAMMRAISEADDPEAAARTFAAHGA